MGQIGSKHVFWQALLSAVLIFGVGILLGVWIEHGRNTTLENGLLTSEINVLDSQLLGQVSQNFNVGCNLSKQEVIELSDRIYNEAKSLEQYDSSSQLTDTLQLLHKRYDILRVILWNQAANVGKACRGDFHTVVYLYQYKNPSIEVDSTQTVFSRILEDIKQKEGDRIVLIPIAGDLNISSIDLIKKKYNLDDGYPIVIVDETKVIKTIAELTAIQQSLTS
jgi:hypothetical protein